MTCRRLHLLRTHVAIGGCAAFLGVWTILAPASWSSPARAAENPWTANGAWMHQPESVKLLAEMNDVQAQFEAAHLQQVAADQAIAELATQIAAQGALTTTARAQIEQYARWAYMGVADNQNVGALSDLLQTDSNEQFLQGLSLVSYIGGAKAQELQAAIAVLREVQELRKRQQDIQAAATATMTVATMRAQDLLDQLNALMPSRTTDQDSTTSKRCPDSAPTGSLTDGSAAIGVKELCKLSVKQARTPAAAAAIVWAFNHLGVKYTAGAVPIADEDFDGFACTTFVAKSFYWGAGDGGFLALPWTPAFARPPAFIKPIGDKHQSGDINIMWRSADGIGGSGGQAGHAQLFIADGWVIQSGGTGRISNVARYPNGWPGWQETHFAVDPK